MIVWRRRRRSLCLHQLSSPKMTSYDSDEWLYFVLDPSERETNPDLNWDEMIKGFVPRWDRVFFPELEGWRVTRRHRQLVNTLYVIYRTLTHPDPSLEMVRQIPQMLECIEAWCPGEKVLLRELQEMVAFEKYEMGGN